MKQVIAAVALTLTACQQNSDNMVTNAGGGTVNIATNNAVAAAPPAQPDPATQTGPVALASDAGLPAPCQTVVRETQACIDNLSGAQAAFREEWLRSMLASSRQTWASAQDDSYRGPVCEQDLRTLRQRVAGFACAAR